MPFSYFLLVNLSYVAAQQKNKTQNFEGTYVFSQSPLQDSLFIKKDSTYVHTFVSHDKERFEAVGMWAYNPKLKEILFKRFVFFNNAGSNLPPGNWFSKVYINDQGGINLMYSRENNLFFEKVSDLSK